jgi:hypothetical protein
VCADKDGKAKDSVNVAERVEKNNDMRIPHSLDVQVRGEN